MEIKITKFYNNGNHSNYSANCAELGVNAAKITWNAALEDCADYALLDNADKLEAMREWAKASGGWDDEEIATWSDNELNALFVQLVSGDIREKGGDTWEEYNKASEEGQVSGALFEGVDGEIYYYLGV